jgi:ubiquinone/menaquinone biosynthesis C-methylase UbiE
LRQIAVDHPRVSGFGLDISAGMVAEAQRRAREASLDRLDFVHGDWEREGLTTVERLLGDRLANRVFCISAFHYFQDPVGALERMRAILSADGELYLMERTKTGSLMTVAWGWLHELVLRDAVTFYGTDELQSMLSDAGFEESLVARHIRRFLWNGKAYTSLVLMVARGRGTRSSKVGN